MQNAPGPVLSGRGALLLHLGQCRRISPQGLQSPSGAVAVGRVRVGIGCQLRLWLAAVLSVGGPLNTNTDSSLPLSALGTQPPGQHWRKRANKRGPLYSPICRWHPHHIVRLQAARGEYLPSLFRTAQRRLTSSCRVCHRWHRLLHQESKIVGEVHLLFR